MPLRQFVSKSSHVSIVRVLREEGMVLFRLLKPSARVVRVRSDDNCEGIMPVRELTLRIKTDIDDKFPSSVGIIPVRQFSPRCM